MVIASTALVQQVAHTRLCLKISEHLSFTPGFSRVIRADDSEVNRFNGFSVQ